MHFGLPLESRSWRLDAVISMERSVVRGTDVMRAISLGLLLVSTLPVAAHHSQSTCDRGTDPVQRDDGTIVSDGDAVCYTMRIPA